MHYQVTGPIIPSQQALKRSHLGCLISIYKPEPRFPYLRMIALLLFVLGIAPITMGQNTTKDLFNELQDRVFQIRVIDIASGDKYSIGSGFLVSDAGHLATNFHVISSYVHEPEKFRLELSIPDGPSDTLDVLAIDVISDLAILKTKINSQNYLTFESRPMEQGSKIFSMGNPRDLGMTIIEGTFNGLVKNSRYQKFLFSGSLNPGMSGGPAINEEGAVVGVNVAKGGEQISFLVPVAKLEKLLKRAFEAPAEYDFSKDIEEALIADQENFYSRLISSENKKDSFGELSLPSQLSPALNCWGHTLDDENIRHEGFHQHCRSEDRIFIRHDLYTGDFSYSYEWLYTTELNSLQFYSVLQSRFSHAEAYGSAKEKYVKNYTCHTDFVKISAHSWKVSSCFRQHKEYTSLYDALLLLASVDENKKAAIVKMAAGGISKKNALQLFKMMMESISWED